MNYNHIPSNPFAVPGAYIPYRHQVPNVQQLKNAPIGDNRLPHSLEKVLTTINRRAEELGIPLSDIDNHILREPARNDKLSKGNDNTGYESQQDISIVEQSVKDEEKSILKNDQSNDEVVRSKKKQLRYQKKRERRKLLRKTVKTAVPQAPKESQQLEAGSNEMDNLEIEYVQEELPIDRTDPAFAHFRKVAHYFKLYSGSVDPSKTDKKATKGIPVAAKPRVRDRTLLEEEKEEVIEEESTNKISKKQLKKLTRLSVAELKQLVIRPDVVEMHDVTARDPKLLVLLKSTRNTVPVPRHWSGKRKYLQGKRGFVKSPFELPEYIKWTGIMEMRQSLLDKDDHKSLKQKMRERIRPKLGKIEIDYQKLHDAFFKFQTKPRMSIHGDLYYEGKENEIKLKQKKPGHLSDDLRAALGMPVGQAVDKVPPPWLIAMQRYGPPPSYPNLKIPGLNAPIPESCSFGYHAGGWGKPPVDEMGRPLYGDVFGCTSGGNAYGGISLDDIDLHVDKSLWGEIESEEEDNMDAESDDDDQAAAPNDEDINDPVQVIVGTEHSQQGSESVETSGGVGGSVIPERDNFYIRRKTHADDGASSSQSSTDTSSTKRKNKSFKF